MLWFPRCLWQSSVCRLIALSSLLWYRHRKLVQESSVSSTAFVQKWQESVELLTILPRLVIIVDVMHLVKILCIRFIKSTCQTHAKHISWVEPGAEANWQGAKRMSLDKVAKANQDTETLLALGVFKPYNSPSELFFTIRYHESSSSTKFHVCHHVGQKTPVVCNKKRKPHTSHYPRIPAKTKVPPSASGTVIGKKVSNKCKIVLKVSY